MKGKEKKSSFGLGPRTNLNPIYKGTSLGLGPKLRYTLGKILGTQECPTLQVAFICIVGSFLDDSY